MTNYLVNILRKITGERSASIATLLLVASFIAIGLGAATAAPKKKRILYLGDSMSMGDFGRTLDQQMRDAGFDVYTFVAGGATPYYWLSRYSTIKGPIGYWEKTPANESRRNITRAVPKVETLMERYNPDVVIVQTGTNLYATLRSKRRSKENNVKEVEGLLNHMVEAATQGGRKCYWITPPDAHPGRFPTELQKELNDITKRVVSREAKVFDSSSVTKFTDPYPKTDGIHYGPSEARQWASHVAKDFCQFMAIDVISKASREIDMPPNKMRNIPRAIPVNAAGKKSKPPEKLVLAPAKQQPAKQQPAKQRPPEKTVVAEDTRPPIQYVKKAVPLDPLGVSWGRLDLEVKLLAKSKLKSLKDIDYSYCFAMNEYEVVKVNSGYYPYDRIRIARVVMWGKQLYPSAIDEPIGFTPRGGWELVPMSDYPRFEQMQMVDDFPFTPDPLPVYIIAFD